MEVMISIPEEMKEKAKSHATSTLGDVGWEIVDVGIAFQSEELLRQFGDTFDPAA